jgi:UDP-N-acetylglucosamine acyltransferase
MIKPIKQAYRLIYRSNLNTAQAVAELRDKLSASDEVQAIARFIEESERGIIR